MIFAQTATLLLLLLLPILVVVYYHHPSRTHPPPRVVVRYVRSSCDSNRRSVVSPVPPRGACSPSPSSSSSSSTSYTTVGYLSSPSSSHLLLPLYARRSPTHRSRYNYYTRLSGEHAGADVRLPVIHASDGRDCTQTLGCEELYDGDTVRVPGLPVGPFTVHRYAPEFTLAT